ncbi:hypothetical protein PO909_028671 [Leuciscus waleckii]
MERFTVGSEGLDLIFNQHFRRSSRASLSPTSTGQHRGEAALFGRRFIACSAQARVDGSTSCWSGEFWGVVHVQHAQTCVNIVGDQRAGPRTCRSYLGEKQRKMGSLSIHVLRFTQCSGLGKGGAEQSATEGNTPTADEGENKGLERQKTFTDGRTRQRETELEKNRDRKGYN